MNRSEVRLSIIVPAFNEEEIANQGEGRLAHDVDLPEDVGRWRLEALDSLDRRKRNSAQMVTSQDPSNGFPVDRQLQMRLNEPSRPVFSFDLKGDDTGLDFRVDPEVLAPPSIEEPIRSFV
jgi:hypothetical protein